MSEVRGFWGGFRLGMGYGAIVGGGGALFAWASLLTAVHPSNGVAVLWLFGGLAILLLGIAIVHQERHRDA